MSLFNESAIASMEMKFKQGISCYENPDKVISLKGMEYIEEIERDTKYSSCLNTRIQAVIGKGWKIIPHSRKHNGKQIISTRDQEIADFIRDQLYSIPVFETDVIAFFDHISKGFSLSEINYKRIVKGHWQGKIGLKNIRKKQAKLFTFKFDDLGYYIPVQVNPTRKELDPEKFIHFINGLDDENPWGESVGSKVAFWVWVKKNGIKFWSIYTERFGMPMKSIEIPNNVTPGSAIDQKADELLEAFETASGVKVPAGLKASLIEATRAGDGSYEAFRKACNDEIATLVLGQPLSTGEGTKGSGTHALGEVHAGVLNAYTLFDVIISSAAINNQLIRRLVDINFDTETYPVFEWNSFNMSMLVALAQNLHNLVDSGLRISAKDIYDKIGLSVPENEEEILKALSVIDQLEKPKGQDLKIQNSQFAADPGINSLIKQNKDFIKQNDAIVDTYVKNLAAKYQKAADLLKKAKDFSDKTQARVKNFLQKEIEGDIYGFLMLGDLFGRKHARDLMSAAQSFAAGTTDIPEDYNALEAIFKAMLARDILTKDEFETLSQVMKRKAFTIASVQSDMLLAQVNEALARAVAEGSDWLVLRDGIDTIFDKAGMTRLKSYHLENVVRTNLQTVYSEARETIFSQLDIQEFPYRMVICVLDDRTRPSHARLHKFTRPANDPIWQILKTPFDYECRCTIVMIHQSITAEVTTTMPDLRDLRFIS